MFLLGDKIRVNKGLIETLIQIERPHGLFQSKKYKVVRRLIGIKEEEHIKPKK